MTQFRAGFWFESFGQGGEFLRALRAALEPSPSVVALDLETTGLLPPPATLTWGKKRNVEAFIVSLSVTVWPEGEPSPTWTGVATYPSAGTVREVMRDLRSVPAVVAHNATFELEWLTAITGELPPITDDTRALAKLARPEIGSGLKGLVIDMFGDDYGIGVTAPELHKALSEDPEQVWEYNALDTWYTALVYGSLLDRLTDSELAIYQSVHKPMVELLARLNGAPALWIDADRARSSLDQLRVEAGRAHAQFQRSVPDKEDGTDWNPNSSAQLQKLLYEQLGLPIQRSRSGKPTVDARALTALRGEHSAIRALEAYRAAAKLANMLGKYVEYADDPANGSRLPAHYAPRTATGRLACERENLQQVPRDQRVRGVFGAPPGRTFVAVDYSQIELRLAAVVSGDQAMIETYRRGADLHRRTAAGLAGVPEDQVTAEQRTAAKAANFGLLYGMGANGFREYAESSYGIRMSDAEARAARAKFFDTYPGLSRWHQSTRAALAESVRAGCASLTLPHGQRLAWPEYRNEQHRCERQAINAQVQGLAALVMFRALVEVSRLIDSAYQGEARIVGTVHDSILIEADDDAADDLAQQVREVMEDRSALLGPLGLADIPVPLVVDIDTGTHWT